MPWITALVLVSFLLITGGYVFWQYRTAQPPPLGDMPEWNEPVPLADVPAAQRADGEARLRDFAATVRAGYHVADEHFFAAHGPFIWDALRKDYEPRLASSGYQTIEGKTAVAKRIIYDLFRHEGALRRHFNDDMILVAALNPNGDPADDTITMYAYFRLTPQ